VSLSESLDEYGESVGAWLDQSKKAASAIQRLHKAVQSGRLRDIDKLRLAAKDACEQLSLLSLDCPAFEFDSQGYLEGGGAFVPELLRAAEDAGVRLYERDGVIFCYPVLVRAEPALCAVRIDRKLEFNVRPETLAALLKKMQSKEPRGRPERFIEVLFKVYEYVVVRKQRYARAGVPLKEVHEVLTLLPGADKEYTQLDFTRDLYFLDSSGITETRGGQRMSLPASTVSRERGAKILRFVTRDGHEKQYAYIKFTAPQRRG
jgi:hypothetical protein